VYFEVVSRLETIVEDLKPLPPERLKGAAEFVRRLKPIGQEEREARDAHFVAVPLLKTLAR
jgi:hypothetical protein